MSLKKLFWCILAGVSVSLAGCPRPAMYGPAPDEPTGQPPGQTQPPDDQGGQGGDDDDPGDDSSLPVAEYGVQPEAE